MFTTLSPNDSIERDYVYSPSDYLIRYIEVLQLDISLKNFLLTRKIILGIPCNYFTVFLFRKKWWVFSINIPQLQHGQGFTVAGTLDPFMFKGNIFSFSCSQLGFEDGLSDSGNSQVKSCEWLKWENNFDMMISSFAFCTINWQSKVFI